jgi:hypothetical protein
MYVSQLNSFFPGSEDERTTTVSGSSQGVRTALISLVDEVEEDRRNPMLHVVIPATSAAHLLASGSAALRTIGAQTQTQIIALPALPNFDERVFRITRQSHAYEHPAALVATGAVQLMEFLVANDRYYTPYTKVDYPSSYRTARAFPDSTGSISPSPTPGFVPSPVPSPVPMYSANGGSTPPPGQEQPKSRIEALRDQLLRLAKVEQAARQEPPQHSGWGVDTRQSPGTPPSYYQEPVVQAPSYPNLSDEAIKKAAEVAAKNTNVLDLKCFIRIPSVSNKACSALIGIGGSVIQEIQECTGAKVRVHQDGNVAQNKEVTVLGPVHAVHAALIAVYEVINRVNNGEDNVKGTSVVMWLRETICKPKETSAPSGYGSTREYASTSRDYGSASRDYGSRDNTAPRDYQPRDTNAPREYVPRDPYARDYAREPPRDYEPYAKRFRR